MTLSGCIEEPGSEQGAFCKRSLFRHVHLLEILDIPEVTLELKNDYVFGFIICEIFTVITLQDWVGWGIFYRNSGVSTESER